MTISKDDLKSVIGGSTPFDHLGPILRVDVKKLIKDIESMDDEHKKEAMNLLSQYVVYLENIRV